MSGSKRTALQALRELAFGNAEECSRKAWPGYMTEERWYVAQERHAGAMRGWDPGTGTLGPARWPQVPWMSPQEDHSLGVSGFPEAGSSRAAPQHRPAARGASRSEASGSALRSRNSPRGPGPLLARPRSRSHPLQLRTGPLGLTGSFRPSAPGKRGAKKAICF